MKGWDGEMQEAKGARLRGEAQEEGTGEARGERPDPLSWDISRGIRDNLSEVKLTRYHGKALKAGDGAD